MNKPIIIIGAGGHAKVLLDTLLLQGVSVLGISDTDPPKIGSSLFGIKVFGGDEIFKDFPPASVHCVNGLGSINSMDLRKKLFESYKDKGYFFAQVIHPSALIAREVTIGEGSQIMAGAIIQPSTSIGKNCILNTGVSIDHDCEIQDHVHVAPGVTLSGSVKVGRESHIGTGAVVIQNITIGERVLIAAGAVVTQNIPDGVHVKGVPARRFE